MRRLTPLAKVPLDAIFGEFNVSHAKTLRASNEVLADVFLRSLVFLRKLGALE